MHVESTGVSGVPGGLSGLGGARRGGGAGLCAICKVPTGVIRSRALQSLRDLNASQRWRAGDASSVKTSAGAGAAGASDTGKASVVSLWRLHESLARVYVEMRRDGVSGEQEVGAAGGVKRRDKRARGGMSGHCL